MVIRSILPFVRSYVDQVDQAIGAHKGKRYALTRSQKYWLGFCILAVMLTHSVCWARFERISLGSYSLASLSWMFKKSKLCWETLLFASTKVILAKYGITKGVLVIDDSDNRRSKNTQTIHKVHKRRDKTTGGYQTGQCIVFLLLVTDTITVPVGFEFYQPDPIWSQWKKEDKVMRKRGVAKKDRPKEPAKRFDEYPTIPVLAVQLLDKFKEEFSGIKIQCVLADALYGTNSFLKAVNKKLGNVQVISQIKKNQNIKLRGIKYSIKRYFEMYPGVPQELTIRGGKKQKVWISSARLHVCRHGVKRFIIALKYEGEKDYRYLMATHLSWRTQDIANAYTLRWLIEVFIQDWKANEGWGQLAKQPGEEGSSRGLTLSLLSDHSLFFHPSQLASLKHKQPAYTVGSLRNQIKIECLQSTMEEMARADDPAKQLGSLVEQLKNINYLQQSKKHLVGCDLGRLEATETLKYRAVG